VREISRVSSWGGGGDGSEAGELDYRGMNSTDAISGLAPCRIGPFEGEIGTAAPDTEQKADVLGGRAGRGMRECYSRSIASTRRARSLITRTQWTAYRNALDVSRAEYTTSCGSATWLHIAAAAGALAAGVPDITGTTTFVAADNYE